ncbi:acetoacetate decarboxylase family protein, partial [Tsukamurella pulmonis]
MDVTYPPEPWHLTGHCLIGVFLVPAAAAPAPPLPTGARTLTVFGRTIVATAFFVYERPSPLTYNEIMSTTVSVRRLLPFVSIPFIQVDSPASRAGGRELWAIPKELNRFAVRRLAEYTAKAVGT